MIWPVTILLIVLTVTAGVVWLYFRRQAILKSDELGIRGESEKTPQSNKDSQIARASLIVAIIALATSCILGTAQLVVAIIK
jgi:hypothetical protein